MKKHLSFLFVFLLTSAVVSAQDKPGKDSLRDGFGKFVEQFTGGFNQFSEEHDTGFARFYRRFEADFLVFTDSLKPRKKPVKQPWINPRTNRLEYLERDTTATRAHEQQFTVQMDSAPERNDIKFYNTESAFSFYGKSPERGLSKTPFHVPDASETSEKKFCKFYYSDSELQNNKTALIRIIQEMQMNDFGDFLVLRKAVPLILHETNGQVLFLSLFMRSMLRKDVLTGYDDHQFYCLVRFDKKVYNLNTISIGEKKYHILLLPGQKPPTGKIGYYEMVIPGNKTNPVCLGFTSFPRLNDRIVTRFYPFNGDTLKINTNQFLIEYLAEFPLTDLQQYFEAPLSETAQNTLDKALKPKLEGKSPEARVETLLTFFRESFFYRNDLDQFGREKYMFCDEALYYPYTDCEDRAVLFAQLVRRYTGLPVVGLDYPHHVSVAVCMNVKDGQPIRYHNMNFYVCDPTIRNLPVGSKMPAEYADRLKIIEIGEHGK